MMTDSLKKAIAEAQGAWLSKQIRNTRKTAKTLPTWLKRIIRFEGSERHSFGKRETT